MEIKGYICGMEVLSPFNKDFDEWYNRMISDPNMVYLGSTFGEYIESLGIIHAPLFASKEELAKERERLDAEMEQFKNWLFKNK